MNVFDLVTVREGIRMALRIIEQGATAALANLPKDSRGRELLLPLLSAKRIITQTDEGEPESKTAMDAILRAVADLADAGVSAEPPKPRKPVHVVRRGPHVGTRIVEPKTFTLREWEELPAYRRRSAGGGL